MKIEITETKSTHFTVSVELPEFDEWNNDSRSSCTPRNVSMWLEKQGKEIKPERMLPA